MAKTVGDFLFERLVLASDYNVMPTDMDVYAPERWRDDALFRPEVRSAYAKLQKQGWTDALRTLYPDERMPVSFPLRCLM